MKKYVLSGILLALSTSMAFSEELPEMNYELMDGASREIKWDAYFSTFGGYNWTKLEQDDYSENFEDFSYGARASGVYHFDNGVSIQKDLVYDRSDLGVDYNGGFVDGNVTSSDFDAATHIYTQNSSYLLGAIVQLGKTSFDFAGFNQDTTRFYFGGEAQKYYGNFTFYGQAGYQRTKTDGGGPFGSSNFASDGLIASLEARYFYTDNWRFDVKGTYAYQQYDFEGSDALDALELAAGTEYRFADTPFSLTSDISWQIADNEGVESSRTTVLVGVKMNLGAETLKSRDRGGVTLDPFEVLKPLESLYSGVT
ncbi:MAG: hypothetical protein NXI17_01510 [Alphaproteobacteria bacterium]|nr:hypothetical protein [Alphaproteobacteria bacterium]